MRERPSLASSTGTEGRGFPMLMLALGFPVAVLSLDRRVPFPETPAVAQGRRALHMVREVFL